MSFFTLDVLLSNYFLNSGQLFTLELWKIVPYLLQSEF